MVYLSTRQYFIGWCRGIAYGSKADFFTRNIGVGEASALIFANRINADFTGHAALMLTYSDVPSTSG